MKELITQAQAGKVLTIVAIAAPAAGIVVGAAVGLLKRRLLRSTVTGLTAGLAGTAIFALWRMYLAIGAHYGYASVKGLAIQLIIFAGLGVGAGVVIQRAIAAQRERQSTTARTESRPVRRENRRRR